MDIQWSLIWTHSNEVARRRRRFDAFADPLEGPEWKGLGWSILPLSKLMSGQKNVSHRKQEMTQVERFTNHAIANSVCVS